MPWNCFYCTYKNHDDATSECILCGMPGKRKLICEEKNDDAKPKATKTTADTASAAADDTTTKPSSAASRKRKVKPSSSGSGNLQNIFTSTSSSKAKDTAATSSTASKRPAKKSTSTTTAATASKQTTFLYPHSFSHKLVPKRSVQDAKRDAQTALESIFKLQQLRSLQPQAVEHALQLQSQMIVMATGGGKSLCYQLPATILGGVTIVISPLLALMKDQTEALNAKGVPAACINSSQTETQNKIVLQKLVPSLFANEKLPKSKKKTSYLDNMPVPVLLYITPESIQTERMRNVLKKLYQEQRLAMFAVDEAHCLSSWGHDFRPSYRRLGYLRTNFPKTPCMALTATATPNVIKDITNELSLQGCPLNVGCFDRSNIFYKVKYKDGLDNPIQDVVKNVTRYHKRCDKQGVPCSGIVYVHKREETTMIALAISKAGVTARGYHAGLKKADRLAVQEGWSSGQIQVAVATVAFGMGIDLAHVRYVIHWCLPKSIEGFYQESGRAGRDGLPSQSILYYSADDVSKFNYLIRMQAGDPGDDDGDGKVTDKNLERKLDQLDKMDKYCTELKCRRNTLIEHFGGEPVNCRKTCDYCHQPQKVEQALRSAKAVKDTRNQSTSGQGVGAWDGQWSGPHGEEKSRFANDWGDNGMMVGDLRVTGPLEVDPGEPEPSVPKAGGAAGFVKASSMLAKYEAMEEKAKRNGSFYGDSEESAKPSSVNMPDHLIASLKAASSSASTSRKKKAPKQLSSEEHENNVNEIQQKLDRMKAEREARLEALKEKTTNKQSGPPPPPPQLSFGRK